MARQRDPARDKAKQLWLESGKKMQLIEIADKLGKSPEQIRQWKSKDHWESGKPKPSKKSPPKKSHANSHVTNDERSRDYSKITAELFDNDELNDRQKMFCLYYLQRFNATWAYQKVYGVSSEVAHASGSRLLANVKVQKQLTELKKQMSANLFITAEDLAREYGRQAFANVGDYIGFGSTDEVDDETGEEYKRSFTYLKNDSEVDTSLIDEVRIGRDGVVVKLQNKQHAMDALMKYLQFEGEENPEMDNDGFLDALRNSTDVWNEEDDEDGNKAES